MLRLLRCGVLVRGRGRFERRRCGWSCVDFWQKPVAAFVDGLDEFRAFRVIAEDGAEIPDDPVDGVLVIQEFAVRPERMLQLSAGDDGSGVLEENGEELGCLLGDAQAFFASKEVARRMIKFEVTK